MRRLGIFMPKNGRKGATIVAAFVNNRSSFIGRLVADAVVRNLDNGRKVTNFRIAVNRPEQLRRGGQDYDVFSILRWGAAPLKKGQLVSVSGRMQTRSFEGRRGTIWVTELVAYELRALGAEQGAEQPEAPAEQPKQSATAPAEEKQEAPEAYRLNISSRIRKALHAEGIKTFGQLRRLSDEDLMSVKGIGPKSVEILREELAKYGIRR